MTACRVLIIDDSSVARKLIARAVGRHADLVVAGVAASGAEGLSLLPQLEPDAVILDIEMPVMNGLETLRRLRVTHPHIPVILFSAHSEGGARATLEALAAGADDYVAKPSAVASQTLDSVVSELLAPKILALTSKRLSILVDKAPRPAPRAPEERRLIERPPVEIVVIASSTGGPNALAEILPRLDSTFRVPIVIVQHMPPVFTKVLAERLDTNSRLSVAECDGGELLAAGKVWIAKGDHHVELDSSAHGVRAELTQAAPENSCRPAADVLFRSAARVYGPGTLGVVLTGMGQDGLNGARAIVAAGGAVICQSRATCVVWGMPRAVEEAGLSEAVIALADMANEITSRVTTPRARLSLAAGALR